MERKIGGKHIRRTREQFEAAIAGAVVCEMPLDHVGTFYLVRGRADEVYLNFYNDATNTMHSSWHPIMTLSAPKVSGHALGTSTFLLDNRLFELEDNWSKVRFMEVSAAVRERLLMQAGKALGRIRDAGKPDFTLLSSDGHKVEVQACLLKSLWPWFGTMLNANMAETALKRVSLEMRRSTIEVVLRYLYEEPLDCGFEDAVSLICSAQMYDLRSEMLVNILPNTYVSGAQKDEDEVVRLLGDLALLYPVDFGESEPEEEYPRQVVDARSLESRVHAFRDFAAIPAAARGPSPEL
ncbi:hypothetical protein CJU89_6555 [Yarrowia sp. B02]|nr:hypothetical protein CJU89_6555 [Yarrowia sp. B02]